MLGFRLWSAVGEFCASGNRNSGLSNNPELDVVEVTLAA
jgi:hypothetical protein